MRHRRSRLWRKSLRRSVGPMRWPCWPSAHSRTVSTADRRPTATTWSYIFNRTHPTTVPLRRCSNSLTAASTFPRKRRSACRAMRRSSRCGREPMGPRSMSAARPEPFRPRFAERSPCVTSAAVSRDAPPAVATHITLSIGPTEARRHSSNLVLLCRRHHRLVHEGGYGISRGWNDVTVVRPDGRMIEESPSQSAHALLNVDDRVTARSLRCWDGTPLNLGYVIDVLRPAPDRFG